MNSFWLSVGAGCCLGLFVTCIKGFDPIATILLAVGVSLCVLAGAK